ncbi:MAG: hypothetical protein WAX38_01220 [Minisyncoccia bacterium]
MGVSEKDLELIIGMEGPRTHEIVKKIPENCAPEDDVNCPLCGGAIGHVVRTPMANAKGLTDFYCGVHGGAPIASVDIRGINDPLALARVVGTEAERKYLDELRPVGKGGAAGSHYD